MISITPYFFSWWYEYEYEYNTRMQSIIQIWNNHAKGTPMIEYSFPSQYYRVVNRVLLEHVRRSWQKQRVWHCHDPIIGFQVNLFNFNFNLNRVLLPRNQIHVIMPHQTNLDNSQNHVAYNLKKNKKSNPENIPLVIYKAIDQPVQVLSWVMRMI